MTIFPRHARLLANFPWNSELHMTSMSPIIRQKKCLIPHPTVMPGSSSVAWSFLLAMLKLFFGSRLLPYNLCNMVSGHGPEFTSLAAVYFHGTWCRREPHIDEIVSWKGYWGWAIYFMTWEYFGTHKLRIEVTKLLLILKLVSVPLYTRWHVYHLHWCWLLSALHCLSMYCVSNMDWLITWRGFLLACKGGSAWPWHFELFQSASKGPTINIQVESISRLKNQKNPEDFVWCQLKWLAGPSYHQIILVWLYLVFSIS